MRILPVSALVVGLLLLSTSAWAAPGNGGGNGQGGSGHGPGTTQAAATATPTTTTVISTSVAEHGQSGVHSQAGANGPDGVHGKSLESNGFAACDPVNAPESCPGASGWAHLCQDPIYRLDNDYVNVGQCVSVEYAENKPSQGADDGCTTDTTGVLTEIVDTTCTTPITTAVTSN